MYCTLILRYIRYLQFILGSFWIRFKFGMRTTSLPWVALLFATVFKNVEPRYLLVAIEEDDEILNVREDTSQDYAEEKR